MGKGFRRNDFWDHLGGKALVMIGRWYWRQPLTNHNQRLLTVEPKACTHVSYSIWNGEWLILSSSAWLTGSTSSSKSSRFPIRRRQEFILRLRLRPCRCSMRHGSDLGEELGLSFPIQLRTNQRRKRLHHQNTPIVKFDTTPMHSQAEPKLTIKA